MSTINPHVRSIEERAEQNLATLNRIAPPEALTPTGNDRDNRYSRDTLSPNGSSVPDASGQLRDIRGNSEPRAFFELIEHCSADRAPGVYWVGLNKDKETGAALGYRAPRWVCSPLRVAANTRDAQGGEWGRLLVFRDRDGREHRWCMPMRMMAGSCEELRAELLAEGLTISSDPQMRRMVADYIQSACPEVTARCNAVAHGDRCGPVQRPSLSDANTYSAAKPVSRAAGAWSPHLHGGPSRSPLE